jgi:hypothetical protein
LLTFAENYSARRFGTFATQSPQKRTRNGYGLAVQGGSQERRSDSGCNYAEEKAPRFQQGFSLECPSLASTNLSSGYTDTKIFCSRLNG